VRIQAFAGAALYLYLPENILLAACNFLPNYCFFVSSVHLPVEVGYGCSLSVASNVFVITNLTFTCRNKNNAPHECGNPKCKARALGWLADERFPRACSTSAGCFACCAGWRARESSWHPSPMPNCTNWLVSCDALLHRKGGCSVHQLARSWLQYRLTRASIQRASKSKLPIKLSRLGFPECA